MQQPVVAKALAKAAEDGPEASATLRFTNGSTHKVITIGNVEPNTQL